MSACLNTEIRKLRSIELYTLGNILNISDAWKKLMIIMPEKEHIPKFNGEHVEDRTTIDFSTVPFAAISYATRQFISSLLNPKKFLPCENGLPRDWRGLAHLLELSGETMSLLVSHSEPTMHIFKIILEENGRNLTIKDFQTMMEYIDRWDVVDDTETMFENDATKYFEEEQRAKESANVVDKSVDQEVLTLADVHRLRNGLRPQYYDAFLLFADEDVSFASEMVQKLETEYKLKLCLKDRDLIGGVTYEHEAVMKLIYNRCNRLIIIVSPSFLESSANQFFMSYAQALSIDKRQRTIIPCLYKSCNLPVQLKYLFMLDYNRRGLYDFWGKLRDSIQTPNPNITSTEQRITGVTNASLDNHNASEDTSSIQKAMDEDTSNCLKQYNEDYSIKKINDVKTLNPGNKKDKTLLKWVKDTTNRKAKQTKQSDQLLVETIKNLPSLDNLDSLNSATDVYTKKKKTFLEKLRKKGEKKKIAMKVN